MIEKMKFLSITGPKADIDRVVNTYLSKYEIHLENALSELTAVESLSPFMEINPYKEALSTANSFYDELADPEKISAKPMDTEQALNTIRRIQSDYQELSNKRADLESQLAALDESLRVIRPFRNINYNISSILKFQFIHFRFGRIEKEYYQKFEKYIYENLDTIFIKCDEDDQYVWGLYFVPEHEAQKVKAVYSSMHFERIYMPDTYEGTAKEAFEQLTETRNRVAADLASADQKKADFLLRNQLGHLILTLNPSSSAACATAIPITSVSIDAYCGENSGRKSSVIIIELPSGASHLLSKRPLPAD